MMLKGDKFELRSGGRAQKHLLNAGESVYKRYCSIIYRKLKAYMSHESGISHLDIYTRQNCQHVWAGVT